jgi:UDP-N-acetylglucosamine 2-epimerase
LLKALVVLGTRPEAVKLAPVIHECRRRADGICPCVCLTGQHRELVAPFVEYFELAVDEELSVMVPGQSLSKLAARCLDAVDTVLERRSPDCLIVQGDTTTVMAASLAAFWRKIPVVHVEAGLRTGNLDSPFPEELNRRVAGLTAFLHCAATPQAAENLRAEGVPGERIRVTGNTVIDALHWTLARERARGDYWRQRYAFLAERRLVLVTGHRRENFGQGMRAFCDAIGMLADQFPDVEFVYPVHLNPSVQGPVREHLSGRANVHLLDPVPYGEFTWLMDRSTLLLTDSGGVQEEAPTLRKPVVVFRDTTERPEAVQLGASLLVGTRADAAAHAVATLLCDPHEYQKRQAPYNPYGDGQAAVRVVDALLELIPGSKGRPGPQSERDRGA